MLALDGLSRVDRHLVVGGVAVFDAQIVIVKIHVQIRQDLAFCHQRNDLIDRSVRIHVMGTHPNPELAKLFK